MEKDISYISLSLGFYPGGRRADIQILSLAVIFGISEYRLLYTVLIPSMLDIY